jgi:hypothetical protein
MLKKKKANITKWGTVMLAPADARLNLDDKGYKGFDNTKS